MAYDKINTLPGDRKREVENARAEFLQLKESVEASRNTGEVLNFNQYAPGNIQHYLTNAGVDSSYLDPEGKKSKYEMRDEIDALYKQGSLVQARHYFSEIKKGNIDENNVALVEEYMHNAKADLSAIGVPGKDDAERQKNYTATLDSAYLSKAQGMWQQLEKDRPDMDQTTAADLKTLNSIDNLMTKSGFPFAALDQTRSDTVDKLFDARLSIAKEKNDIASAQATYKTLMTDPTNEVAIVTISDRLAYLKNTYNLDASALDPEGKKTAAEVEKDIHDKTSGYYVQKAQGALEELRHGKSGGGYTSIAHLLPQIYDNLALAGADAASLDPAKTKAEVIAEIDTLARARAVSEDRDVLDQLKKGIGGQTPKGVDDLIRENTRTFNNEIDRLNQQQPENKQQAAGQDDPRATEMLEALAKFKDPNYAPKETNAPPSAPLPISLPKTPGAIQR